MPTIGETVARLRKAVPLTQEGLAEASGISVELIRKLERGERNSPRMTTLHALARPLGVPTSRLLGDATEATVRREPDDDELGLLDVRRVLTPARGLGGIFVGDDLEGPVTPDALRASVRYTDELYHHDDYRGTLQALPLLLREARHLARETSGEAQGDAYGLLSAAYRIAGKTLLQVRRLDLAHIALSGALDAAEQSSDPTGAGATAVGTMCWLLTREGRFADAAELAVRTADMVEPRFSRSTPVELANWGWLLLYASGAAARDNQPDRVTEMLDTATAAAARIGQLPPTRHDSIEMGGFSVPKVQMMRTEAAVVAGDPGLALELAAHVDPSAVPTPSCRNRHRLDVAWAHLELGTSAGNVRAGDVLLDLGRTAPTWMRQQRYARGLVDKLAASRRRAMSDDLAKLTALVGADPAGGATERPSTE
ncbi:helix-turn-helix domain-containing protein [Actinoplanes siamensis]|uniref:Transcriptional regulator n=1 Tax=Actinoplanes siamensis TaxID=1223317 RepID=A0A919N8E0_9ACTN|nr:helix-turn-helix domain-containing protein [Actinoplanes siamensis]GIF06357.1 transcriptional regulator [Actinoplanes siamensis]